MLKLTDLKDTYNHLQVLKATSVFVSKFKFLYVWRSMLKLTEFTHLCVNHFEPVHEISNNVAF